MGTLMIPLFFVLASPYIAIDFRSFLRDFHDLSTYGQGLIVHDSTRVGFKILLHYARLAGQPVLGGTLFIAALAVFFWKFSKRTVLLLTLPLLWVAIFL